METPRTFGRRDSVSEHVRLSLVDVLSCAELKESIREVASAREKMGWTLVRIVIEESCACLEFRRFAGPGGMPSAN